MRRSRNVRWTRGPITDSTVHFFVLKLNRALFVVCCLTLAGCGGFVVRQSAGSGSVLTQTATINWTNQHQVIDGFGASDAFFGSSMSSAHQQFFFGTGSGQLGLSILRVPVTNGGASAPGSCSRTGSSCAGPYVSDMQAIIANGGRVYASAFSPPAAYMSNRSVNCTDGSGNGALISGDYSSYATWITNFVQSVQAEGVTPYSVSIQNEPDECQYYDSAVYTASQMDTFIKNNLGPTFASDGISSLIFMPENSGHGAMTGANGGGTCATDSSCSDYVGGYNFHDYDATLSGNAANADPYPSGWASGKKYWETEASCLPGPTPSFCQTGFNTNITDALQWAAVIDQRIAVDGLNAWLYWRLIDINDNDDQGLESNRGTVAARAYVLGQYSKFVRPGYYCIDATHLPRTGVSVSAYQNAGTNTLVIIATNYTGSAVSQTFSLTNAPAFSTMTPTITSASLNLVGQSNVNLSGNSFTYVLPAGSITTFVGSASTPPPPSNLFGTVVQ